MTPRESMITALEGKQPVGLVPHMELVFFLTMEALGKVTPGARHFGQWEQMTEKERELHRRDVAEVYVLTARKYQQNAIFFHAPYGFREEDTVRTLERIREISGMDYFLMLYCDPTLYIPDGSRMMQFVERIADEPDKVKAECGKAVDDALEWAARWATRKGLCDGMGMCSDYCFNSGPFVSPAMFDEFITPYLARTIAGLRDLGYYTIKHTDGNIMPILDSLVATRPHALHSLDPQGGVDIAEVKRRVGKQVCLIGNVSCGLLQTGTDAEVVASARYALKSGMPGGGYIFGTSNCVYTGMPLERYELMLKVRSEEGVYPDAG
jgi:uroporphyrinogen decarboxylase